jgi:hypothetical protein
MSATNNSANSARSIGTFTVLDIMLFVAACSISTVLIRLLRPPAATLWDYLSLTATYGPAGLSLFGPWAVRRQFLESSRDELWPGEWLWIALGGTWLAATPLALVMGGKGVEFVTQFLALVLLIPATVALIQSLSGPARKPWTHWTGIALSLLHALPALIQIGPVTWLAFDRIAGFIDIFRGP